MAKLLAAMAVVAGQIITIAWLLMLAVGVIHTNWLPALPQVGYPTMLVICALLYAIPLVRVVGATFLKTLHAPEEPAPAKPDTKLRFTARTTGDTTARTTGDTTRIHWVNPRPQDGRDLW